MLHRRSPLSVTPVSSQRSFRLTQRMCAIILAVLAAVAAALLSGVGDVYTGVSASIMASVSALPVAAVVLVLQFVDGERVNREMTAFCNHDYLRRRGAIYYTMPAIDISPQDFPYDYTFDAASAA